ncbi:MAG: hypothetical protein EBX11_07345 [Actinobacteria bacterium]|nr:hypothetical protein [Actinomycetota bacterium]
MKFSLAKFARVQEFLMGGYHLTEIMILSGANVIRTTLFQNSRNKKWNYFFAIIATRLPLCRW